MNLKKTFIIWKNVFIKIIFSNIKKKSAFLKLKQAGPICPDILKIYIFKLKTKLGWVDNIALKQGKFGSVTALCTLF